MVTKTLIGSLWPSFYNVRNRFPESLPMTTIDFASWVIFTFLVSLCLLIKPEVRRSSGINIAVPTSIIEFVYIPKLSTEIPLPFGCFRDCHVHYVLDHARVVCS
jgi:hypothetical protein